MTLTQLITNAGGDDEIFVDRPSIRTAKRTKQGDTKVSLETFTTAVTVNDVMALSFGDRGDTQAKVPLLVWIPRAAWDGPK